MMWNPFKWKYLVPISDCFGAVQEAIIKDNFGWSSEESRSYMLFEWLEFRHGVKRKWSWRTKKNYLIFDSKEDYLLFLLKL